MEHQEQRSEALAKGFINKVLKDQKTLTKRLVQLSNVLSREKADAQVLEIELEETVAELIQAPIVTHASKHVRLVAGLCITSLFRLIPANKLLDKTDEPQMKAVFNLLISCLEMLLPEGSATAEHARAVLDRCAAERIFTSWSSSPEYMHTLFTTCFELGAQLPEMISLHICQIMIDVLESMLSVPSELVEMLLVKLVVAEKEEIQEESEAEEEEEKEASEGEESDEEDKLMAHTQEAADERTKREEKKAKKKESKVANLAVRRQSEMAVVVLRGAVKSLEAAVPHALKGESDPQGDLIKENVEFLISKLCDIAPSLVRSALPVLLDSLQDVEVDVRSNTVKCLSDVLVVPLYLNACLEMGVLFNTFVGRFKDTETEIRLLMIQFAKKYLNLPAHHAGHADVVKSLNDRLSDANTKVRTAAIDAWAGLLSNEQALERLDNDLSVFSELEARARDKQTDVRLSAATALISAYNFGVKQLVSALAEEASSSQSSTAAAAHAKAWIARFGQYYKSIPSAIIARRIAAALTVDERLQIDEFIAKDYFFGLHLLISQSRNRDEDHKKSDAAKRTAKAKSSAAQPDQSSSVTNSEALAYTMVYATAALQENAQRQLYNYLADKKLARADAMAALQAPGKQHATSWSAFVEKRLGGTATKSYKSYRTFHLNDDLKTQFSMLVDPKSSEARVRSAYDTITKKTKSTHVEVAKLIADQLRWSLFHGKVGAAWVSSLSPSAAAYKVSHIEDKAYKAILGAKPKQDVITHVTVDLLLRAASIHPAFLVPHLNALDNLLKSSKDSHVTVAIAKISSFTAQLAADTDNREDHIKSLAKVVQGADSKTAAQASAALMAHFSANDEATYDASKFVSEQIKIATNTTITEQVVNAFAALGPAFKHINATQATTLVNRVLLIMEEAASSKISTKLTATTEADPKSHAQTETNAAAEGISLIVAWFRHQPAVQATGASAAPATPTKSPFTTPKKKGAQLMSPLNSPTKPFKLASTQEKLLKAFIEGLKELLDNDKGDLDSVMLRSSAVQALLRLAEQRSYDELIPLNIYMKLAEIAMDPDQPALVINDMKTMISQSLASVSRLGTRYLPFTALLNEDRQTIATMLQTRRTWIQTKVSSYMGSKTRDLDSHVQRLNRHFLPENAIPWLIFLLAHAPFFEEDAPSYTRTCTLLESFIAPLLLETNFDFIFQLFLDIRQCSDNLDPKSHNIHLVAELGSLLINELRTNDKKKHKASESTQAFASSDGVLPATLFRVTTEESENDAGEKEQRIKLAATVPTYLPAKFVLPKHRHEEATSSTNATPSNPKKPRAKRTARVMTNTGDEDDNDAYQSYSRSLRKKTAAVARESPARRAKKGLDPNIFGSESSESESESEIESVASEDLPPRKTAAKRQTKAKAAPKKKKESAMDVDDEEASASSESDVEPPAKRAKRSTATAPSTPAKKQTPAPAEPESESEASDEDTFFAPSKASKSGKATSQKKSTAKQTNGSKKRAMESDEDSEEKKADSDDDFEAPAKKRAKRSAAPTAASSTTTKTASKKKASEDSESDADEEENGSKAPTRRPTRFMAKDAPASPPAKGATPSKVRAKK